MDAGVGLEADDESEVGQVHPRRDLAALVSRLRQRTMRIGEWKEAQQVKSLDTLYKLNVC